MIIQIFRQRAETSGNHPTHTYRGKFAKLCHLAPRITGLESPPRGTHIFLCHIKKGTLLRFSAKA